MTGQSEGPDRHQTVYTGGTIHPMLGGTDKTVEAVLTVGRDVAAVGQLDEIRAKAGPAPQEVDLDGRTLLPGFIDAHPHLLHFGNLAEPLVDISGARSHHDIVARIAQRAGRTPAGDWIQATPVGEPHYFLRRSYRDLAEGELPDRAILDQATTEHPVVIQAWAPKIPNVIAFNSRALDVLGIDESSPDRVGHVWIEKSDTGHPTGRLRGSVTNYYSGDAFAEQLWRKIPFLDYQAVVPGIATATRAYHRLGITAVYENHMLDGPLLDAYRSIRQDGSLQLRVLCSQEAEAYGMPWSKPRQDADFLARLDKAQDALDTTDAYLRFNGVTLMWDGTFNVGGMMMRQPYQGPYGEQSSGFQNISTDKARVVIDYCARAGMRLNVICMGDAAHDGVLPLLEKAARDHDIASLGWVLVHAVFIHPDQIARYQALGMDLTVSMSFSWGNGDDFRDRISSQAMPRLMPLRDFFDAGFAVAASTDWGPKSVLEQMQLALTHVTAGGASNLGPAQRISRAESVRMWTSDAAEVLRWPQIGSLHPGGRADLVLLDDDPFTVPIDRLGDVRVTRTVFDGMTVFDEGGEGL